MIYILNRNRYIPLGLILALLTGLLLFGLTQSAQARERGSGGDRGIHGDRGPGDRGPGDRGSHPGEFRDSRYHHDRTYPARGHIIGALPRDHRVVVHGRSRYYFSGGVWYRPQGPRFVVVAPPFGLFVPFLPPYYATIWVGGIPYYYANEIYYAHRGNGYVVVEPPQSEVSEMPPPADQMFIYPRLGQSSKATGGRPLRVSPLGRKPDRIRPDTATRRYAGRPEGREARGLSPSAERLSRRPRVYREIIGDVGTGIIFPGQDAPPATARHRPAPDRAPVR